MLLEDRRETDWVALDSVLELLATRLLRALPPGVRLAAFDADRWRDNVAVANGHAVLRFTHAHLTVRPDEVLALVLDAGRHRLAVAG